MTEEERYLIKYGLREFMQGWCMDGKKTSELGEPVFRCDECPFTDGTYCSIKQFVNKQLGPEASFEISPMRR